MTLVVARNFAFFFAFAFCVCVWVGVGGCVCVYGIRMSIIDFDYIVYVRVR